MIALGIVVRGFSAYFLQRSEVMAYTLIPSLNVGVVSVEGFALTPIQRLAIFVVVGVVVSLVGVRTATHFGGTTHELEAEPTD